MNPYQALKEGVFIKVAETGSRFICNPPPMDTDQDYICLVKDLRETDVLVTEEKYERGGSIWPECENNFFSYKRDDTNLIITESEEFFNKFVAATSVAKHLNLLNKEDRVHLFQAVLYGNPIKDSK
jgi:hypothetical protein